MIRRSLVGRTGPSPHITDKQPPSDQEEQEKEQEEEQEEFASSTSVH